MRCLFLLTVFGFAGLTLNSQVIPDCGNEDQRACSPADKEFWQTDSLACEYDLKLKTHLGHDDTCVNSHRRTLDKDYSWIGWALSEQRYNIAADLGINFGAHLGTHNSYSNYQQGYVDVISVNQFYSITDQLQAGARLIRLDPWWYYDEMRLCHAENLTGCKTTSAGRLYANAIREIGAWLDANPGEVIVIRIHDSGDLNDHKDYINKPIETFLGSKVFAQTEKSLGYLGRWPTIRELRFNSRQVIIFSSHDYGAGWTFPYGDYFLESKASNDLLTPCGIPANSAVVNRAFDQWALISEGRTMSDTNDSLLHAVFNNDIPQILDEPEVAKAVACSFSNVEVDFFLRLDHAYQDYSRSSSNPDLRREATIWSWQQGDFGRRGPALLDVPSGRWRSLAAANNYPFLCAKPDPTTFTHGVPSFGSPAKTDWRVTAVSGAWNSDNGNRQCAAEFGAAYTFSFPRNALQNQQVLAAARGYQGVWMNYSAIPVPEPSAAPPTVRFTMQRGGALPAPISVSVVGTVRDPPNTFSYRLQSPYFSVSAPSNLMQLAGTPISISVNSVASTLEVGLYQATIQLSESGSTIPGGVISVALEVEEPTTTTIAASPSSMLELTSTVVTVTVQGRPLPAFQDSLTGTVVLQELFTDPLTSRATVQELGRGFLASPEMDSTGPENQVKFTLTLPPGNHSLIARYLGDSHYHISDSPVLAVSVVPLVSVTPSAVSFSVSKSLFSAGPWTLTASPPLTHDAVLGTWSIPAANQPGRVFIYLNVSPLGVNSSTATVTLDPQAINILGPGQYDLDVQFERSDKRPAPAMSHFSMKLLGTLSASSSQVTLAADALSHSVSIAGSGPMPVTVNTHQVPWLSAKLASPNTPSAVLFTADPTGLPPGDYTANVTITSPLSENSVTLPVTLHLLGRTTISSNVPNGSVLVDRQAFSSPATFFWEPGSHHNVNAALLQTEDSTRRWRFQAWSDGMAASHAVILPSTPGAALNLTANYTAEYQLSLNATPIAGGSIGATPPSADGFYPAATPVSLAAQPNNGYGFVGFTGSITGSVTPSTVVMNAPQSVGAVFTAAAPKLIDVQLSTLPAGLGLTVDNVPQPGGTTFHWAVGSTHTITAPATQSELAGARFAFAQWNDGGAATRSLTLTDDKAIALTASFKRQYQLTTSAQPANGGKVSGAGWYDENSAATVTASAAQGFVFSGFSGLPQLSANPQTITVTAPVNVQANFTPQTPNLFAAPGARADTLDGGRSVAIVITNSGGPAVSAQIDSITNIKVVTGSGDTHPTSVFPMVGPTLLAGQANTFAVLWTWPATATRVQYTVNFSTQTGYHGSTVVTMFR